MGDEAPKVLALRSGDELPETASKFLKWTRDIAIKHRPGMAAFVVLAWSKDGETTICGVTQTRDNPIPNYLLPSGWPSMSEPSL